ncbi:MAG TPA: AI-2E family transporter [Vicinamibacterales bacterium]|nr:AI-2E family transporter [Vicinamibacterales bacterium]
MILRLVEGTGVLLLLSVFLAYVLAPALPPIRRRIRIGRRRRPISDAAAILVVYFAVLLPGALVWRKAEPALRHWIDVTAPTTVDRLFAGDSVGPIERAFAPLPRPLRTRLTRAGVAVADAIEHSARGTLAELITAARYAAWLGVTPVVAFLLLTGAPVFQRSALRVLPHGHLQWRFEEYLRDVNSALAGYVRAQAGAGIIVGAMCVLGFLLLGTPSAVSLGVLAGILELVPAIGPLTVLLIAASQADRVLPVVLFLGVLRVAQDYVVYPRLIRHGMHLSTIVVIVTVWTGAVLAGAAGVVIAIPAAGFLSVSLRHWREYREIERLVATVK